MVTEQEQLAQRAAAFERAYRALIQQFGVELIPQVQAEQLGPVIQCRSVLIVQSIADWRPPEALEQGATERSNGKPVLTDAEIEAALRPGAGK